LRRRHAWSCRRGVFAHGGFFHRSTPWSHQSDTPGNLFGSGPVKDAGTLVVPDTFGENGHTDHGLNLTVLPDRQLLVKRSVEPPIALVLAAHKLLQARLPAQDSHVGLSRGERFSYSSRPQAAS